MQNDNDRGVRRAVVAPHRAGRVRTLALGLLGRRNSGALGVLSQWRIPALGAILIVSAVLQLYRINDWQTFSDDQATQMRVVHGMLVDDHLPLLGLALSVGSAHIGPLFYYLLAPAMWLGRALTGTLDPTAGVVLIGLFQVATVYLLYRLCLLVGAPWAGLCAAGLYATSQLVVYWSRFLWPNIAPFFVVLALYALIALAQARPRFVVLLAGSLAAAAQMQPTAVLLIPVAALWLLAVRPRLGPRLLLASGAIVLLLFAPVILYDLTHGLAETRAWLGYGAAVRLGATRNGLHGALSELERFGWQAIGFRTRARVDQLLDVAALAVAACAAGLGGRSLAVLARLLLLWVAVYLLAFALYRGTLHPHYVEPLYPLPFLAVGLLVELAVTSPRRVAAHIAWRSSRTAPPARTDGAARTDRPALVDLSGASSRADQSPLTGPALADRSPRTAWTRLAGWATLALGGGAAVLILGLATANVRHLWADQFGLDAFQLDSPAALPGNRLTLGEMRRAAELIARGAAGEPYSFLLAVRDGAGGGFAYLQGQSSAPPSTQLHPLQFLLVEPADRPPWLWPPATRLRWSQSAGGFMRLPHLMLWQLHGATTGGGDPAWPSTTVLAGEVTALVVPADGSGRVVAGYIGGAALFSPASRPGQHPAWRRAAWPAGPNGRAVISAFAWSPACPRRLYAATFDGLLVSADGGAAWRPARSQPSSLEVLSLLADPRRCGVVLAGTRGGLARSDDGGAHWQMASIGGPPGLAVHALSGDPAGLLYVGTTDGVWVSTDGGSTWPPRRQYHEPRPVLAMLPHPGGTMRFLAGSGAGVVASPDGGLRWTPIGGSPHLLVYALLDVNDRGTLLAGTETGLYISHNGGAYWQPTTLPVDMAVKALALGPGHVIYAGSAAGVYRSVDGGATWQHL